MTKAEIVKLLKEIKDSPTLSEQSNATVIGGKTWRKVCDALDRLEGEKVG